MEKIADIIETAEMPLLDEIVVMDDLPVQEDMIIVEEPAAAKEKDFHWDENKDFSKFLSYLQGRIEKIPQHSGKTTAGCERAIVYLKMLDKEISKAVGEDLDCKVDDQEVEKLRKQIRKMIKQLQKRHDEINDAYDADDAKFASVDKDLVKEASNAPYKIKPVGDEKGLISMHFQDLAQAIAGAKQVSKDAAYVNVVQRGTEKLLAVVTDGKVKLEPAGLELLGIELPDDKSPQTSTLTGGRILDYEHSADDMWKCPECGKEVKPGDQEHISRHNAMAHGHEANDKKEAHIECACQVKKNAAPEDGNCPDCKIKLWATDADVMECIACEKVYAKSLTKEAHTAKLTLVMTPFERAVTGAIVNGFVAGGKNPEEIYEHFKKKYSFSDRDELSIQQILYDMGYPMLKDRGHLGDKSEQLNKGMGIEFSTQYNA